jgi:hypothetical protein
MTPCRSDLMNCSRIMRDVHCTFMICSLFLDFLMPVSTQCNAIHLKMQQSSGSLHCLSTLKCCYCFCCVASYPFTETGCRLILERNGVQKWYFPGLESHGTSPELWKALEYTSFSFCLHHFTLCWVETGLLYFFSI